MEKQMPASIVDQASYDQAVEFGKNVSKMEKYIDNEEKKITKPINDSLKAVRDLFRPFKTKCADAKADVKSKMSAYLVAEEKKRKEQEAKDLARLDRGTIKEETVVKKMVAREETATVTTGSTFKHLVIKSFDLSKVPVEYLILNEALAKQAYKDGVTIEGIEFEYETRARL